MRLTEIDIMENKTMKPQRMTPQSSSSSSNDGKKDWEKLLPHAVDAIDLLVSKDKYAASKRVRHRQSMRQINELYSQSSETVKSKTPEEKAAEYKKSYQRAFKLAAIYAGVSLIAYLFFNGGWFISFIKWLIIIVLGFICTPIGLITGGVYKSKHDKLTNRL